MTSGAARGTMADMTTVVGSRAGAAVAAFGLTLAGLALDVDASVGEHGLSASDVTIWVAFGLLSGVGLLICLARPGNRVGWAMLIGGALSALGGGAIDIGHRHVVHGSAAPWSSALILAGTVARGYGWTTATVVVAAWFPDGKTLPGRWRRLPALAYLGMTLMTINTLVDTHANLRDLPQWHNPLSTPFLSAATGPLSLLGILMYAVLLGLAVAQLAIRFRSGDALLRQQVGLLALVAFLPVFAVVLGVLGISGGLVFGLAVLPLPVAIGFAVLARGLYDLSTAANRTLVWLLLSAAVVTIYALVIVGVGGTLGTHGSRWLPWAAAAVVAVSFAPLRDALQRGVNRVTFGSWEDPRAVLATLGQHLEVSADADRLLEQTVAELQETLRLTDVAVLDDAGEVVAGAVTSPDAARVPATAYGGVHGELTYRAPVGLRPHDLQLIDDLAAHVGVVLHARRLTADLQRTRERLVIAREEERRRLRRDLHDGLGPALAGHLLRVDLVAQRLEPGDPGRQILETLRGDLQNTVADVRRVVEGLRPPSLDEIGLAASIAAAARNLTAPAQIGCELRIADLPRLSAAVEVAAYRILMEAVTNVVKHSKATTCCICLAVDAGNLVLEVADDGAGGISTGSSHGQDTMRERAEELGGVLEVRDAGGVHITARLPLGARLAG